MNDESINWFYGLMADRVAEFTPEAHQVPFFEREIQRFGQPVLDVGCGGGRTVQKLAEIAAEGKVYGIDLSDNKLGALPATPSGYVPGAPIIVTPELGEGLYRLQHGESGFDAGGGALVPYLPEYLQSKLNVPLEIANPLRSIDYDPELFQYLQPEKIAPLLAVSIGLAMRKAR